MARKAVDQLEDPDQRAFWNGRCDFFEGEILLRQQRIDEALAKLESALAARPDAQVYYRLADGLARKLELGVAATKATPMARRALRYCQEAQRLDWIDELKDKLDAIAARLESSAKSEN